jgi:hypothetical protein
VPHLVLDEQGELRIAQGATIPHEMKSPRFEVVRPTHVARLFWRDCRIF